MGIFKSLLELTDHERLLFDLDFEVDNSIKKFVDFLEMGDWLEFDTIEKPTGDDLAELIEVLKKFKNKHYGI